MEDEVVQLGLEGLIGGGYVMIGVYGEKLRRPHRRWSDVSWS
jgi:hypothetical protein